MAHNPLRPSLAASLAQPPQQRLPRRKLTPQASSTRPPRRRKISIAGASATLDTPATTAEASTPGSSLPSQSQPHEQVLLSETLIRYLGAPAPGPGVLWSRSHVDEVQLRAWLQDLLKAEKVVLDELDGKTKAQ